MFNAIKIVFFVFVALALSGCKEEEAQALLANPAVVQVGVFEGCKVTYINRGYESTSFYIAKCNGDTTTVTQNGTRAQGKSRVPTRNTTIVEDTAALQEEIQAHQKQVEQLQSELKLKKDALAKLSDEEKAALGLVEDKSKKD